MALKGVSKPRDMAPILLICGDPGAGKTTLANTFQDIGPGIFIRSEDVSGVFDHLPVDQRPDMFDKLPRATSRNKRATSEALLGQIDQLIDEDHNYKWVAFDTISAFDDMLQHEVLTYLGGENLAVAGGGYGAGWNTLSEIHGEIVDAFLELRATRDMTIIWLGHQKNEQMRHRPDAEAALVFGLEMHDKCHHIYRKHADAVLFCRIDSYTKGVSTDKKGAVTKAGKIISSGERSIITSSEGNQGYVYAKNRYDLPPVIEFPKDEPILVDYLPYYATK